MSKKSKKSREREKARAEAAIGNAAADKTPAEAKRRPVSPLAVFRELIESGVVALVLAFLFRTFEAEAFVIPTGSMAPTLMGRHKDHRCETCGHEFAISASEEVEQDTGALRQSRYVQDDSGQRVWVNGERILSGVCPMCRNTVDVKNEPSFNGDRILVNKFAYQFADPERFDIAVFHFPGGAETNYIKRIVGLPGETLRIQHGDLFVRKAGEASFTIARKTPNKLRAMLRLVHDNDRVQSGPLLKRGWPPCWQSDGSPGGWAVSDDDRSFSINGDSSPGAAREAWLRFHYVMPDQSIWRAVARASRDDSPLRLSPPNIQRLIDDFCAYNTGVDNDKNKPAGYVAGAVGTPWVGDLGVQCSLETKSDAGDVLFELIKGGRKMHCRIDLASGDATLSISGEPAFQPVARTAVRGPGTHEIFFVNADDELRLWVDDKLVEFDRPTTFDRLGNDYSTQDDLSPVGVASIGAGATISGLKVWRDTYYHSVRNTPGDTVNPDYLDFPLEEDQFLALGDNSQKSNDSRLWSAPHHVPRGLLIGKALFIYWPHSWDKIPGTEIPFPFFPNVKRMNLIR